MKGLVHQARDAWKRTLGFDGAQTSSLCDWSVVMLQLAGQILRAPKTRPLPDS